MMKKTMAITALIGIFVISILVTSGLRCNPSSVADLDAIVYDSTTVVTWTYTATSIMSYTITVATTTTSLTSTTATVTQNVITTSTLQTTTSTTATSTVWRTQTSTIPVSRTSTSVVLLTSSTATTVTNASISFFPTINISSTNASYKSTAIFSPTITVTFLQTSVTSTTSMETLLLATTTTTTVTSAVTRPCIIASAAYGSEMAPQVQLLREFRDYTVTSTFVGSQFMRVFNTFYYSFSPVVAQAVLANQTLALLVRLLIIPLIKSLRITSWMSYSLPLNLEQAILFVGVLTTSLIGAIYAMPFAFLNAIRKRRTNTKLQH
jgi:hypothetical protein